MSDNGKWRNRIVGHGIQAADQFIAHPDNPKIHPALQREVIKALLGGVGWVDEVKVSRDSGYLVDGHERVWAALAQGDSEPVPYMLVDLTPEEELEILATFDPSGWLATHDSAKLDALLQQVNTDSPALQEMLANLATEAGLYPNQDEPPGDPGAAIDRAQALQQEYGVERGQLWLIGRHRLLCGDAYSLEDRALLCGDLVPDMLHTDPPYGIGIVKPNGKTSGPGNRAIWDGAGSTASAERKGKAAIAFRNSRVGSANTPHAKGALTVANEYPVMRGDDVLTVGKHIEVYGKALIQSNVYPVIEGDDRPFDPAQFLDVAPITIMWGANYYADKLPSSSGWIVWDKRENITRNNFADCELAWSNLDKPARIFYHLWNGLHKGSQHGERRTHPTEKPVALFEEIGTLYAPKGIWLDLFAGTGAQMVAGERAGATVLANEIEPLYVATVLDRMKRMGLSPRRA